MTGPSPSPSPSCGIGREGNPETRRFQTRLGCRLALVGDRDPRRRQLGLRWPHDSLRPPGIVDLPSMGGRLPGPDPLPDLLASPVRFLSDPRPGHLATAQPPRVRWWTGSRGTRSPPKCAFRVGPGRGRADPRPWGRPRPGTPAAGGSWALRSQGSTKDLRASFPSSGHAWRGLAGRRRRGTSRGSTAAEIDAGSLVGTFQISRLAGAGTSGVRSGAAGGPAPQARRGRSHGRGTGSDVEGSGARAQCPLCTRHRVEASWTRASRHRTSGEILALLISKANWLRTAPSQSSTPRAPSDVRSRWTLTAARVPTSSQRGGDACKTSDVAGCHSGDPSRELHRGVRTETGPDATQVSSSVFLNRQRIL